MTEEANKHTEGTKAAYESQNADIADEGHVTSNDVNLADYPGKAEALREGREAREEAQAEAEVAEDVAIDRVAPDPIPQPQTTQVDPEALPVQPTREGE